MTPRKRRIRPHGHLPAGFTWRDGQPRWIPAPGLRKAGWKGRDLKDGAGQWLKRPAAIEAAEAIMAQVNDWRAGRPVAPAVATIAPAGAVFDPAAGQGEGRAGPLDPFALGTLIDAYLVHVRAENAPRTARDYEGKLTRLLDAFAGHARLPDRKDMRGQAARAAAMAEVRSMPIFAFAPYEGRGGMVDPWTAAYRNLKLHAGTNQAYGVMACAGAFLSWVNRERTRRVPGKGQSWVAAVQRQTPKGRIVTYSWEEIALLVHTADAMGLPSIGDAIVLSFDLSWSQIDVLSLTWPRIQKGRAMTGQDGRIKTGRIGGTPLLSLGRARLARILQRQRAMAARPTHVVWSERTGAPWKGDHFRHIFAEVRTRAAETLPAVAGKYFSDLRDTAFTWAREGGLDNSQIASRTLQSLKNIDSLSDRHYGQIGAGTADEAAGLLNDLLARRGVRL